MRISDNFYLSEFTNSQTARRHGIDNTPTAQQIKALTALVTNILQPVRNRFGPIFINSGFRSKELNTAIGGSPTSQHMKGQAADIECPPVSNMDLAVWIRDNLDYDQLILEFHDPKDGPRSGWVHVSYVSPTANRKQTLSIRRIDGVVTTLQGLV